MLVNWLYRDMCEEEYDDYSSSDDDSESEGEGKQPKLLYEIYNFVDLEMSNSSDEN